MKARTWRTVGNWAIVALLLMGLLFTTLVAVQQLAPPATAKAVAWELVPFPPPPPLHTLVAIWTGLVVRCGEARAGAHGIRVQFAHLAIRWRGRLE